VFLKINLNAVAFDGWQDWPFLDIADQEVRPEEGAALRPKNKKGTGFLNGQKPAPELIQNENFNANWMTRGPALEDVILPNVPGTRTLLLGGAKFTVLKTLKNSVRNSSFVFSLTGTNLMRLKSTLR